MPISIGSKLTSALRIAIAANQPTLLLGKTGVGKSQIVEQVCKELNIGYIVRDLSLMEPADLVGMPRVKDDRTHFAPPSFLPYDEQSHGILMFEELNRAPQYMLAPTLELLTTRRLNDYILPAGWLPMAAINPHDDEDYVGTRQLDAALLARFMKITVEPSVKEWVAWAETKEIRPDVIAFIKSTPGVFKSTESNPRAWVAVSDVLNQIDAQAVTSDTTMNCIAGLVGDTMASAFLRFRSNDGYAIPDARNLLQSYGKYKSQIQKLSQTIDTGKLSALVDGVLVLLQDPCNRENPSSLKNWRKNAGRFANDLPAEHRRMVLEALTDEDRHDH